MIANLATVLIGLWLAYRAIFASPPGAIGETELVAAGTAVLVLALWARRTDVMRWHSATNIVLAIIILLLAAAQRATAVDPLVAFWIVLLAGITQGVAALWSILYRPGMVAAPASH